MECLYYEMPRKKNWIGMSGDSFGEVRQQNIEAVI